MTDLVYLLLHPMQGTETSERNIMKMAADEIARLRRALNQISGYPAVSMQDAWQNQEDMRNIALEAIVK